ncbi:MAG: hypothetical protein MJY64_01010 [archaeon]|nr:hypothetical protein [archaeon]
MTSLVYLKSKKNGVIYVYVNEKSEKDGKYHRKCIGHLDTFGGEVVPNRKRELSPQPRVRSYGINAVLRKISDEIGLTESLRVVFIDTWDSLLSLTFYCLTERAPLAKLGQWMEYNETPRVIPLTNSDVTSILKLVSSSYIESFFRVWKKRLTDENFILTLFSSSRTTEVIKSDLDEMFPANVEICYGKNSLLPISYAIHRSSYDAFSLGEKPDWIKKNNVLYFIDGSLYSSIGIDSLFLAGVRYAVSLPSKDPLFKEIVSKNRNDENFPDRVIKTVKYRIRGRVVFIHIMYDPKEAEAKFYRFLDIINTCRSELDHKRYVGSHVPVYHRYFSVDGEKITELSNVGEETSCLGFRIILSNSMSAADRAIKWFLKCEDAKNLFSDIHNDCDTLEMKFYLKSYSESRIFIQFLALILYNALERKIGERGLKESVSDVLALAKELVRVDMPGRKRPMMSEMSVRQRSAMELLLCDDVK